MICDAFHLPGLADEDVREWEIRESPGGEVALRIPVLHPYGLQRLLERLRRARAEHLLEARTEDLLEAIGAAAERLASPSTPEGAAVREAFPATAGYSSPMARRVLERMAADWDPGRLRQLLRSELDDSSVLESFRPQAVTDGALHRRAFGPEVAYHIFAGNVPGVAVTAIVRSLLVRAATLGKTGSGELLLAPLFARCLAGVSPGLGECLAVTYWRGGDEELEEVAMAVAEVVVVYGGASTVRSVRRRLPPGARLVEHGPRLSFGIVGREALEARTLDGLLSDVAEAVAMFDQHGCVSPQVIYVERGGEVTPSVFAGLLADALGRIEAELPRGPISMAEAAAIHDARAGAEFRALRGEETTVFAGPGTRYTVLFDGDPALTASCLGRTVWVKPLERIEDVVDYLGELRGRIQTVGVAGAGGRLAGLAELLGRAGVSRVTDFRRMPWPPPWWHHDGTEPLRELIRWTDLEA